MNLTYQNQLSDRQAFYEYAVTQTPEGRRLQSGQLRLTQSTMVMEIALVATIIWAASGRWETAFIVFILLLLLAEGLWFVMGGYHPVRAGGLRVYKAQEQFLTATDFELLELERTITVDDQWLSVSCNDCEHRWRWRLVQRIGITSEFIFIHVGACPVMYVPRRAFASDQALKEFGARLEELRKAHENEEIGA